MKTKDLVLIALFAALTAIGGFLNIPTPLVPFSLQFLFCAYAGVFLGSQKCPSVSAPVHRHWPGRPACFHQGRRHRLCIPAQFRLFAGLRRMRPLS